MADSGEARFRIGDVQTIGGIRVVCVPDYMLTKVNMTPGTTGVLLPPTAADLLVATMAEAGIIPPPSPEKQEEA